MVQAGTEDCRISSLKIRFAEIQERIKNIKVCLAGIEISPAIVGEVRTSREALHRFFSQLPYQKLCSNCHVGHCCIADYGQYVLPHELIYFVIIGYNLPTPDWEFLKKEEARAKSWCMFMGPEGCLLKENRRVICLRYYCRGIYLELKKEEQYHQFSVLIRKLETAIIAFNQEVLKECDSRLDKETELLLRFSLQIKKTSKAA